MSFIGFLLRQYRVSQYRCGTPYYYGGRPLYIHFFQEMDSHGCTDQKKKAARTRVVDPLVGFALFFQAFFSHRRAIVQGSSEAFSGIPLRFSAFCADHGSRGGPTVAR